MTSPELPNTLSKVEEIAFSYRNNLQLHPLCTKHRNGGALERTGERSTDAPKRSSFSGSRKQPPASPVVPYRNSRFREVPTLIKRRPQTLEKRDNGEVQ